MPEKRDMPVSTHESRRTPNDFLIAPLEQRDCFMSVRGNTTGAYCRNVDSDPIELLNREISWNVRSPSQIQFFAFRNIAQSLGFFPGPRLSPLSYLDGDRI